MTSSKKTFDANNHNITILIVVMRYEKGFDSKMKQIV